jgi:hypothetical protein
MTKKRKTKHSTKKHRKSGKKKKNKLGVVNSLVNNINARRKKHIGRSKKKKTVSKRSYHQMKKKWKA